jgi:hypothetical protein
MKKEIRLVDQKRGILQLTTVDERFYIKSTIDKKTELPIYTYVPSVTWICEYYPKGIAFFKWLAQKGWDEAEALKIAAGDKGSKIHQAITKLIAGETIKMDGKLLNNDNGLEEEIKLEEYEAILTFVAWFKKANPKIVSSEIVVWNDKENYAGTVDILCKIGADDYLIDIKTGQNIWPSYELQLSAYKHAIEDTNGDNPNYKLAILQLGYNRNKDGYKFTELEDQYPLFLAAKQIWAKENKDKQPAQKDLPVSIKL